MADSTRAADLPDRSVVATDSTAYIKTHPTATAPWRGTNGGYFADVWVDEALTAGGRVLRVGDRTAPVQRTDRSGAEQAALDAWERGSGDTMGMLYAVRDALAHQDRTEDARLALAERKAVDLTEVIAQIRDLAYRAGSDPESMRDALTAIHQQASRAVAGG